MTRRIIPHAPSAVLENQILAVGELVYDETEEAPRFGDGATPGGRLGNPKGLQYQRTAIGSVAESLQNYLDERMVDASQFEGADKTGATSSSGALKKAVAYAALISQLSTGPISSNLTVHLGPGVWYLGENVEVDKRIGLCGDGVNTVITGFSPEETSPSTCGIEFSAPATTGIAPHVRSLTFFGFTNGPCMRMRTSGGMMSDLYFSSSVSGIDLAAEDGGNPASDITGTNLIFDQMLSDVRFYSAINVTFTNVISFLTSVGAEFLGTGMGNSDITLTSWQFGYPLYSAVTANSAKNKNVQVNGCSFMLNAQHSTFQSFIYTSLLTSATELFVKGCNFRNWKDYAVRLYGANIYSVKGCVFDATKTLADYSQSAASKAIAATGCTLEVMVEGCEFRNVAGALVDGYSGSVVTLVGGSAYNSTTIFGNDGSCTLKTSGFRSAAGNTLYGVTADYGRAMQINGQLQFGTLTGANTGVVGYANGTTEAGLLCYDNTPFWIWTNLTKRFGVEAAGHLVPGADNVYNIGSGSARIGTVYAGTGAINTSDERTKQQIRELSDAERRVGRKLRGLIQAFRFNDAVEKKGDGARWHFGVIAQQVRDAFDAEGIDGLAYGVLCYDEWPALEEIWEDVPPDPAQATSPAVELPSAEISDDVTAEVGLRRRALKGLARPMLPPEEVLKAETAPPAAETAATVEATPEAPMRRLVQEARPAGSLWGVRENEAMWLILAAL